MVRGLDLWNQPVGAHGGGRRNQDPTSTNKTVGRCSDGDWNEGKDMVRRTTSGYAPHLMSPYMASTGAIVKNKKGRPQMGIVFSQID